MKKVLVCDFTGYNSKTGRLGNYHYCNCFAQDGYEALWIGNAFNQLIYFKDREDYLYRKSMSSVQRHQVAPNIYEFAPYSILLYGNYPFLRNTKIVEKMERFIRPDLGQSLKEIGFLDVDVLWLSNPKMFCLTNVVNYKKLIYRIADDYSQFAEYPNIQRIERILINRADEIVVTSSTLERNVRKNGKNPILLRNGADFDHFSQNGVQIPREYEESPRPKIVYVGAIKYWFDTELIAELAEKVDADIFLIGKIQADLALLNKFSNVHLLGARSYELLPGYLQYADVALIPFLKTDATNSISPIKLYEYCSAGVPVVSTDLAETVKLQAPIWLAATHQNFIEGVEHYLTQGCDRSKLIEFGRNNTWIERYKIIKSKL